MKDLLSSDIELYQEDSLDDGTCFIFL